MNICDIIKSMVHFLKNIFYFKNPVKYLRNNFNIEKDKKPYIWLIKNKSLKKIFELAEEKSQENYTKLLKKGFNNKEILWMNSGFFEFISEPSDSEIRFILRNEYWHLFSLPKITHEYFLCAIAKEKFYINIISETHISDRTRSWDTYYIKQLFLKTEFEELKKIIKAEPFLITKMNPINLELALIATLEHPKIYKYITCVENKNISETIENLRSKIEILEALK